MTTLDAIANCFSFGPMKDRSLRVVGHTDPRGGEGYNKELGQSRADAVAEYLISKGVERSRVTTVSRGEQSASGEDERGWSYDRRVDIQMRP